MASSVVRAVPVADSEGRLEGCVLVVVVVAVVALAAASSVSLDGVSQNSSTHGCRLPRERSILFIGSDSIVKRRKVGFNHAI